MRGRYKRPAPFGINDWRECLPEKGWTTLGDEINDRESKCAGCGEPVYELYGYKGMVVEEHKDEDVAKNVIWHQKCKMEWLDAGLPKIDRMGRKKTKGDVSVAPMPRTRKQKKIIKIIAGMMVECLI